MGKKSKKCCTVLNDIERSFVLFSTIAGCISVSVITYLVGIPIRKWYQTITCSIVFYHCLFLISAVAYLVGIPIGILSSIVELKICVISGRIKKYKLMIKKTSKRSIMKYCC